MATKLTITAINGESLPTSPSIRHLRIWYIQCPPRARPLCPASLGHRTGLQGRQLSPSNWLSRDPGLVKAPEPPPPPCPPCPACPLLGLRGPSPASRRPYLCPGWGWASFPLSCYQRPILEPFDSGDRMAPGLPGTATQGPSSTPACCPLGPQFGDAGDHSSPPPPSFLLHVARTQVWHLEAGVSGGMDPTGP